MADQHNNQKESSVAASPLAYRELRPEGIAPGWPSAVALAERVRSRHGWKTGHDELTLADYTIRLAREVAELREAVAGSTPAAV